MSGTIRLRDLPGGIYELTRLAIITRLRFRGPYWTWRLHTAFGRGYPASRWELVHLSLIHISEPTRPY